MVSLNVVPSEKKSCGECTVCCTILAVSEIQKPQYQPCQNLKARCSIYDSRPASCRNFECLWRLDMVTGDERRRPDNVGLMFTANKYAPQLGFDYIVAWEIVPDASSTSEARYLIDRLANKHFVLVKRHGGKSVIPFGPPAKIKRFHQVIQSLGVL